MKKLPSQKELREAFDYADGALFRRNATRGHRAGERVGGLVDLGYWRTTYNRVPYFLHRLIWAWHYGEIPKWLDHIDGDPGNNRIENLRLATSRQNAGNRKSTKGGRATSSKWRGVYWETKINRWVARLQNRDGINPYIGVFKCEADAAQSYNFAAFEYFGEFASLNIADQTGITPREEGF